MNIRQAINAAITGIRPLRRFALLIPAQVWMAAAALVFLGLWLQEHDSRIRHAAELEQVRQQAASEVSELQARAGAAVRQANQRNARAIAELEAERRRLSARAGELSRKLESAKQQGQARAQEIAALSPEQLRSKLEQQLGPGAIRDADLANSPGEAARRPEPLGGRPAQASETLRPGETLHGVYREPLRSAQGDSIRSESVPGDMPESRTPITRLNRVTALSLTDAGARKAALAIAERDSCRDEGALQNQQLANCREQLAAYAAEIQKQADSLAQLNQALDARDRILARREAEFKAQLAAARGTWPRRLMRTLKYVAIGVGIGAAIR